MFPTRNTWMFIQLKSFDEGYTWTVIWDWDFPRGPKRVHFDDFDTYAEALAWKRHLESLNVTDETTYAMCAGEPAMAKVFSR